MHQEHFKAAYTEALRYYVAKHPEEYFYTEADIPQVVDKMMKAIILGRANIGPALKKAARKLGIKGTLKGIQEYLTT